MTRPKTGSTLESTVKAAPPPKKGRTVLLLFQLVALSAVCAGWWILFKKETILPAKTDMRTTSVPPPSSAALIDESMDTEASSETTELVDDDSRIAADTEEEAEEVLDPAEMEWNALSWAVTDAVVNEAFPEALALTVAAQAAPHPSKVQARLNELEEVLRDLPVVDDLVMAGFTRAIGQEILLMQNGKPHRVIIRAVSANAMSAVEVSRTGTVNEKNTVTIKAASLDPKDKLKWLGDASTPSRAMVKCLLHVESGNLDQARTYAAKAGPLSDQLLAWVDAAPASDESADVEETEDTP